MLKNYVLSALRSLKKKFGFTLVNVLGLALGMSTCLLIYLYVDYDLSYDKFQKGNVYRIALNRVYPEREVDYTFIPHSISPQLEIDFPEVVGQTRFGPAFGSITLRYGDEFYIEDKILFPDSTFFNIINVPFIEGDPKTALTNPNSVVISESTAIKIFGEEDAMGKSIIFSGFPPEAQSKQVTGIIKDYPANSHLEFDYLVPGYPFYQGTNWTGFNAMTYIELDPSADADKFMEKIPDFIRQSADGEIRARNGISYDEYIEAGNGYNYYLQPIEDIHLHSNLEGEIKANGNINYVYIFAIVAVFILIIACINFMNLSTARSTERSKEAGIRKVLGSAKSQLIGQFLTESVIISILAAAVATFVTFLAFPYFNDIAGRPLSLEQVLNPLGISSIVLIVFRIGLLAGIYPAFFISSFAPVSVLKEKLGVAQSGISLRNVLVILQFSISIALISCILLVFDQMGFMMNKPLGFDKESVIVIENSFALNNDPNGINFNRFETFKTELNKIPEVHSNAYTSAMPGDLLPGYLVCIPGTGKESMMTRNMVFDDDMIESMDMTLLEGRFFSQSFEDSLSIILNKSAVEKLGLVDPTGKKLVHVQEEIEEFTIVGVIEDFHFQSIHVNMEPMTIISSQGANQFFNKVVVKVDNENVAQALSSIESKWDEFVTDSPFQSYFLDEDLDRFYESERATSKIFTLFTVLAIIIACVGLLGLSAFVINQRVKEIGVRKVLGATIPSLILLLSMDFTKLIGVAAIIAVPAAYFWMEGWLENFAYAVGINWFSFIIAGGSALLIGLLTVSFQSIKAALSNPIESLRDE